MNRDTERLMTVIEVEINNIEKSRERAFENFNILKDTCRKVLGFNNHILWHINFNASKLMHMPEVFENGTVYSLKSYNDKLEEVFEEFSTATNMNAIDLMVSFNQYLINKAK